MGEGAGDRVGRTVTGGALQLIMRAISPSIMPFETVDDDQLFPTALLYDLFGPEENWAMRAVLGWVSSGSNVSCSPWRWLSLGPMALFEVSISGVAILARESARVALVSEVQQFHRVHGSLLSLLKDLCPGNPADKPACNTVLLGNAFSGIPAKETGSEHAIVSSRDLSLLWKKTPTFSTLGLSSMSLPNTVF